MARLAATYRAARRNSARAAKQPMAKYTVVKDGMRQVVVPLPEPRYVPHLCKPHRLKWRTFQVGTEPNPLVDVMVPCTELRTQPRVYRGPIYLKPRRAA